MSAERLARSADIAVIGAGPKAAALAAKVHTLNTLGLADLRLLVLERAEPASSWTGRHGFTTGLEALGTRPEKDVGFPYRSLGYGAHNASVNQMMQGFSWQAHLVAEGTYSNWVDSGAPQPTHRELARYLSWVFERAVNGVAVRPAHVTRCKPHRNGWLLGCRPVGGDPADVFVEHGLVLTGTGQVRELPCTPEARELVFSASEARRRAQALDLGPTSRICIVGAGESAASMALYLIDRFGEDLELTFVAGTLLSSRAESYLENTVYSDPDVVGWERLPEAARAEFIARTDRGVMSPTALARLARHRRVRFVLGKVTGLQRSADGRVRVNIAQAEEVVRMDFDAVANCIGFCVVAPLLALLGDARAAVEKLVGRSLSDALQIARHLDPSFALRGLESRLHLPALAGLLHGPGFSNLSCLGALSDRILAPYVDAERNSLSVAEPARARKTMPPSSPPDQRPFDEDEPLVPALVARPSPWSNEDART